MTERLSHPAPHEESPSSADRASIANRQSSIDNSQSTIDSRQSTFTNAPVNAQNQLRQRWAFLLAALMIIVIALAWSRVGALGLPSVPRGITLESAGLANLEAYAQLDAYIRGNRAAGFSLRDFTGLDAGRADRQSTIDNRQSSIDNPGDENISSVLSQLGLSSQSIEAVRLVRDGLELIHRGDEPGGLAMMRDGVRRDPSNLVLGNAYRMAVFRLQRAFLQSAHERAMLVPAFPPHLDNEPIAFFESIAFFDDVNALAVINDNEPQASASADSARTEVRGSRQGRADSERAGPLDRPDRITHRVTHPNGSGSREVRLQLALAWVDKMLLFPALEVKAPSSVEAVDILTELINDGNPGYVPALFARGLNHLHRPARLVWPESDKTAPDAAAKDIGLCVAIGRHLGAGSDRLQATLAIALGDAYVKAGRYGVARSWWQIAQNLSGDDDLHRAIRRRYAWHDEEMIDRLEEDLDRARSELDNPMTDLALMWN